MFLLKSRCALSPFFIDQIQCGLRTTVGLRVLQFWLKSLFLCFFLAFSCFGVSVYHIAVFLKTQRCATAQEVGIVLTIF